MDKSIFLDIDGAMSYAIVWLNGQLVGGWPYGYNSFRLDLTPFIKFGGENQLVIRLDNPNHSARWYPGAGLYRNVWLTKTNPVHVGQWGTYVTTKDISLESNTRAFIRRDRNYPSVIMWSFGNEVGEQYTGDEGAAVAKRLSDFVKEEDPTRPTTLAMNFAKPDMPLPQVPDVIGLNYQGEGIRQDPEFEGTDRIRTTPQYEAFHAKFPNKVILSAETASAFSSRGIYLFPVTKANSSPTRDGRGGDSKICQVSSYEIHAVDFGSSADKVFGSLDRHPFVAGEFVWNEFDYIGEPTPYYEARSSYSGMIDLADFKKDRFFLYQSRWRPDLPMSHILPHWNWAERVGEVTPVHVFTSGDEAELFLNGKSLEKRKKEHTSTVCVGTM